MQNSADGNVDYQEGPRRIVRGHRATEKTYHRDGGVFLRRNARVVPTPASGVGCASSGPARGGVR
jgi:hypothetical protein